MIAIVDYGIGNLGSVTKGFRTPGRDRAHRGCGDARARGRAGAARRRRLRRGHAELRARAGRGLDQCRTRGQAAAWNLHWHAGALRGKRGARPPHRPRAAARPRQALQRHPRGPAHGLERVVFPTRASPVRRPRARRVRLFRALVLLRTNAAGRRPRDNGVRRRLRLPLSGATTCWACSSTRRRARRGAVHGRELPAVRDRSCPREAA